MDDDRSREYQQISIDQNQTMYHTVAIRADLPRIRRPSSNDPIRQYLPPNDFWLKQFFNTQNDLSSSDLFDIQYSRVNGPCKVKYRTLMKIFRVHLDTSVDEQHPVLSAFLQAYNFHEDLILSPDDFWLMISIYFSIYVNENCDELAHLYFEDNETNRILTIENDETTSTDWKDFLHRIHFEMKTQIKTDLCQLLKTKFSTTTDVESLLSSLVMMSTFKKCTNYRIMSNACGIRSVHFLGTLDDWILLEKKSEDLKLWTKSNDEFSFYIDGILPILQQFIRTYRGDVDQEFWDKIFDLEHKEDQSNQSDGIHINGWFLRLCYGNHRERTTSMKNLRLNSLFVPVHIDDEHTSSTRTSFIIGGFHGVDSFDGKHKPVLSFLVVDDRRCSQKLEK